MSTEQTKPTLKTVDVLAMLEEGKTREEIGAHYSLNKSDTKKLFAHPDLKGKKKKGLAPRQAKFLIEGSDGAVVEPVTVKQKKYPKKEKVVTEVTEASAQTSEAPQPIQEAPQGTQGSEAASDSW
jgi:hypothetical protein